MLGFVLTGLIVGATYALARKVVGAAGAFLAAAVTVGVAFIPDNYSYILPHTFAATLGTLVVLVSFSASHGMRRRRAAHR